MFRLAVLAITSLGLCAPAQGVAAVGETVPQFEFPKLINGDGRQKLEDFRGHPVLIEFWGTL